MTRGFYLLILAATLTTAGCHKDTAAQSAPKPEFGAVAAPGSAADVMAHTASRFGVPVYPGAIADTSHFSMADNVSQTNPRAYLMYMTPDSLDQVVDFYRSHLTMEVADYQGTKQLKGYTAGGAQVTINVGRDNSSNQTRFVIMAFMSQTGGAMMSAVSAPAQAPATPMPARQNAASQDYNQGSQDSTWTFSTNNGDDQPVEDSPIPQPQDDYAPSDSNPPDAGSGQGDPAPPDDGGGGEDPNNSNPPGDPS